LPTFDYRICRFPTSANRTRLAYRKKKDTCLYHKEVRYLDLHEDDKLDEEQMATWIRQAAALPGWVPVAPAGMLPRAEGEPLEV
jgi:hypothetical protein